jgi:hypothetical protein
MELRNSDFNVPKEVMQLFYAAKLPASVYEDIDSIIQDYHQSLLAPPQADQA